MGKADIQLHSDLGDGLHSPTEILAAAEAAGLAVIALTDHDDIRGASAVALHGEGPGKALSRDRQSVV